MSRFLFETIRLENGQFFNLDGHQKRFDASRSACFFADEKISLSAILLSKNFPKTGLFRCRAVYGKQIERVEFLPYKIRQPLKIGLVEAPEIEYDFKWEDRAAFVELLTQRPDCQEVIITKNGLLTDSTVANLAFFDGKNWLTPASFLLPGTRRKLLLDEGILREEMIFRNDLRLFKKVALLNAMRGLKWALPIEIIALHP